MGAYFLFVIIDAFPRSVYYSMPVKTKTIGKISDIWEIKEKLSQSLYTDFNLIRVKFVIVLPVFYCVCLEMNQLILYNFMPGEAQCV